MFSHPGLCGQACAEHKSAIELNDGKAARAVYLEFRDQVGRGPPGQDANERQPRVIACYQVPDGAAVAWQQDPMRAGRGQSSWPVNFEAAAHGGSDGLQVVLVGADHQVMPAEGAFDYARVHDVAGCGASGERADRAGLGVIERFDIAPGQQAG